MNGYNLDHEKIKVTSKKTHPKNEIARRQTHPKSKIILDEKRKTVKRKTSQ